MDSLYSSPADLALEHTAHQKQLVEFFCKFKKKGRSSDGFSYLQQIINLELHLVDHITVHIDDLKTYFSEVIGKNIVGAPLTAEHIGHNCVRYLRMMYEAIDDIISGTDWLQAGGSTQETVRPDLYKCIVSKKCKDKLSFTKTGSAPAYLRASYDIRLIPASNSRVYSIRELRASHLGHLMTIQGLVTRVSSVKPKLAIACYKCSDCDADLHQPVSATDFLPLQYCQSSSCVSNNKQGELRLLHSKCKFTKYQNIRLQELAANAPPGAIPECLNCVVEGSLTRQLRPGQTISLTGIFSLTATNRLHQSKSNKFGSTTFLVLNIKPIYTEADLASDKDSKNSDCGEQFTASIQRESGYYWYEKIAQLIAPNIYGMEDVKKALLLQLVGGSNKQFSDGMKLRGSIHVLLMGDPGVAKSQLLCQICKLSPRSNYTTGKGSSGVGLTAAVVRDVNTGDITLEGGAIVLSDNGICCIDEFDKMDDCDRTAVHEVMEQQTVSISKAGLTTALNARTAILGAANPQYGRYDPRKTPMQNINLPAALLSRFDIQFVLIDRADLDADDILARHVLRVHQNYSLNEQNNSVSSELSDVSEIKKVIRSAQQYDPKLPKSMKHEIVQYYVSMRQKENSSSAYYEYTTPRTLLALLRLSQALARLRFSNEINRSDFEEALRLFQESKRSVLIEIEQQKHLRNYRHAIQSNVMNILKSLSLGSAENNKCNEWILMSKAREACARHGYSYEALVSTVEAYTELNILLLNDDNSRIRFIDQS